MSDDASAASSVRAAVAVLARSPQVAGKTRLTTGRAERDAHALRRALCLDAIEAALAPGWPVHVFLDPYADAAWLRAQLTGDAALRLFASRVVLEAQAPATDLGVRMSDAMARTLGAGVDVVVLVGSDVPDVPLQTFHDAVAAAADASCPLVLGPARDGGFYLVASRTADARVFDGVVWSRASVCAEVAARAQALGRDVQYVAPWSDVDTPEDLTRLLARPGVGASRTREVAAAWPPYNRP